MSYQATTDLANKLQRFWQSNTICAQLNTASNNSILETISIINAIADFEHYGDDSSLKPRLDAPTQS